MRHASGSIGLSIFLSILLMISGGIFVNSLIARQTFQTETVRSKLDAMNLGNAISRRLALIEWPSALEGVGEELEKIPESKEFDEFLDNYAAYISDYMLNDGETETIFTEDNLRTLFAPAVESASALLSLTGEQQEEVMDRLLSDSRIRSDFNALDSIMSGSLGGMVLLALSPTVFAASIIATFALLLLLVFAARPRRYTLFVGLSGGLAGVCAGVICAVAMLMFSDSSLTAASPLVGYLLRSYSDSTSFISIVLGISGSVLCAIGIVLAIIFRPRQRRRA